MAGLIIVGNDYDVASLGRVHSGTGPMGTTLAVATLGRLTGSLSTSDWSLLNISPDGHDPRKIERAFQRSNANFRKIERKFEEIIAGLL